MLTVKIAIKPAIIIMKEANKSPPTKNRILKSPFFFLINFRITGIITDNATIKHAIASIKYCAGAFNIFSSFNTSNQ